MRTEGFYLPGTTSNAYDGIPAEFVVIDASNNSRAVVLPFSVQNNAYLIDIPDTDTQLWPVRCKFQLELDVSAITGTAGEKKIKQVEIEGKNVFANGSIIIPGTYLVQPANGTTLTSSSLNIVIEHDSLAPAGRLSDIHLSAFPQPNSDTDPKGTDLGDAVDLDTGTSYTFTVPENGEVIFGRIYYSDQNWADSSTLIADGKYTDFQLRQRTIVAATADTTFVSPAYAENLTSSVLNIVIEHGAGAPAGRVSDIHLSAFLQPTSDTDPKGNDMGDSSGLGTGTSYTFNVPENGDIIYVRVYYSDNNWADASTLIADGNYTDYLLVQNVGTGTTAATSLVSPASGSTLTSGTLNIVFEHNAAAPAGRVSDIHLSASPQPTNDTDPKGNDMGDSSGLGTGTSYSFTVPQNGATIYGRIYYSDTDFADATTLIADGKYVDFQLTQNTVANPLRAGMTSIALGSNTARGSFTTSDWQALWGSAGMNNWFDDREEKIRIATIDGYQAMEVENTPNGNNGTLTVNGGGRFPSTTATIATLASRIRFPNGFDFAPKSDATGKAGFGIRSRINASGGLANPEGFSSRPQWRRNSGTVYWGIYVYEHDTAGFGDDYLTDVAIQTGQWYDFVQELKINSAYGASDGTLRVWIDGALKISLAGIRWIGQRPSGEPATPHIEGFSFNSHHGGSGHADWAPATNQYPAFADVAFKLSAAI